MPSKKTLSKKNQKTILYSVVGVLAISVVVVGFLTNWNFNLQTVGYQQSVPANVISTQVVARNNQTNEIDDDIQRTWYSCDISEMTAAEIECLKLSAFTMMTTVKSEIETAADTIYVLKLNGSKNGVEYQTLWLSTSALIAGGKMDILKIGSLNIIELFELPAEYQFVATAKHNPANHTIANTDSLEWVIDLYTKDSKNEVSDKAGYAANYNFEDGYYNSTVLQFQFDRAISTDAVEIATGYDYKITAVNTTVFIFIDCSFVTGQRFNIEIDSGLGTDFELVSFAAGVGRQGVCPAYMIQA